MTVKHDLCFSASPMNPDPPRHDVSSKVSQVECKEVHMMTYLMDSYERVAQEERMAPKVGHKMTFNGWMTFNDSMTYKWFNDIQWINDINNSMTLIIQWHPMIQWHTNDSMTYNDSMTLKLFNDI